MDIFDGGPLVRARLDRLRSVEKLRYLTVTVAESDQTADYLMATTHLTQLRIVYAPAVIENDTIGISAALAQQLGVTSGEKLAVVANQQEAL